MRAVLKGSPCSWRVAAPPAETSCNVPRAVWRRVKEVGECKNRERDVLC